MVPGTLAVAFNCSAESALPKVTAAGADQVILGVVADGPVGVNETPLKFESAGAVASRLNVSVEACVGVVKLSVSVIP